MADEQPAKRRLLSDRGCAGLLFGAALISAVLFLVVDAYVPRPKVEKKPSYKRRTAVGRQKKRAPTRKSSRAKPKKKILYPIPALKKGAFTLLEKYQVPVKDYRFESVFRDDFQGEKLSTNFKVVKGKWGVKTGMLVCEPAVNSLLVIQKELFHDNYMVIYEARINREADPQSWICDLSLVTNLPPKEWGPANGYLWRFGSYENTWSGLTCGRNDLVKNRGLLIKANRWHRVRVLRLGGILMMEVDDYPVFCGRINPALTDKARRLAALYVFRSRAEFNYLEVFKAVKR